MMNIIEPKNPLCKCGEPKDRLRKRLYYIKGKPPGPERTNSWYYISECKDCNVVRQRQGYKDKRSARSRKHAKFQPNRK